MGTFLNDKDLDLPLKSFEKFVENVASNGDEGQKAKVLKKLKDFYELITSQKNRGSSKVLEAKTQSQPSRKVEIPEIPYEIWVKIMNYLSTNDIFYTLALVNRNSYQLTKDSKALKYLTLKELSKSDKNRFDKGMKFLKSCKNLVELTIINRLNNEQRKDVVDAALRASPNLKSLNITGSGSEECYCHDFDAPMHVVEEHDGYFGDELDLDVVKTLRKRKTKLENLTLTETYANHLVMDEISKIETLKSLRVLDVETCITTPKVLESLAFNKNQLETIEIDDRNEREEVEGRDDWFHYGSNSSFSPSELLVALNQLFKEKQNTLKFIKRLNMESSSSCKYNDSGCVSLENLSLCQNLVEFCGSLHGHDLIHLAGFQNLQKLKLYGSDYNYDKNLKHVWEEMNLSNLKYLSFSFEADKNVCNELARHCFPALERLYIRKPEMNDRCILQLIVKCPKLKSIQFKYRNGCIITNEFLHKICKERDVFVIFGNINDDESEEQINFTEYLIENDLNAYRKYSKMKEDFSKWCEDNVGYGF